MYINFFKLNETPFSLTPDPRYLFMSERHREGLAHLLYGVQQPGGFVQLTGEIGSGKTTLCRCLIQQLPPDTDVAFVLNPRLTVIELLATVCDELRIPYPRETDSVKVLIDALNQRLLETHKQGRRTVLIIDEAQNLDPEVLEQIRLLTNLETSKEKLLQIILIGQPELLALLEGDKLRQLAQRITARCHLLPLSRRETYAYIQHRLLVAGRSDPLFTKQGLRCVYRLSHGVPRVINVICDRALLGAYALDRKRIGAAIVRRASRETRGRVSRFGRRSLLWMFSAILLLALTIGASVLYKPSRGPWLHRNVSTPSIQSKSILPTVAEKPSMTKTQDPPPSELANSTAAAQTAPNSGAAARKISRSLRLLEVLAKSSDRNNASSLFADLYALWGIKNSGQSELGCRAENGQGLDCLPQTGSWPKLRRYDLPAILDLVLPNGDRRRAVLAKLDDEKATLIIGGRSYAFSLQEIDSVWDGAFTLLWKPPFPLHKLTLGMKGKDVAWICQALDRLEGKTPNSRARDVYDERLRERVQAFQRERLLIPDGCVGSETLVRIMLALDASNAPSLTRQAQ